MFMRIGILATASIPCSAVILKYSHPLTHTLTYTLQVCHEAAMGPIRELGFAALRTVRPEDVRPLAVRVREKGMGLTCVYVRIYICLCTVCWSIYNTIRILIAHNSDPLTGL